MDPGTENGQTNSPVRIYDGHDVDVVLVENVLVIAPVLEQFVRHVRDRGRADPLSRVHAAVDPHGLLLGALGAGAATDADQEQVALLVRLSNGDELGLKRISMVKWAYVTH